VKINLSTIGLVIHRCTVTSAARMVYHTIFILFYFFILQDSPNITDINKTNTLQNLHTIQAGTSHRDNLQLWGPYDRELVWHGI
jgi:hypothetical protein